MILWFYIWSDCSKHINLLFLINLLIRLMVWRSLWDGNYRFRFPKHRNHLESLAAQANNFIWEDSAGRKGGLLASNCRSQVDQLEDISGALGPRSWQVLSRTTEWGTWEEVSEWPPSLASTMRQFPLSCKFMWHLSQRCLNLMYCGSETFPDLGLCIPQTARGK